MYTVMEIKMSLLKDLHYVSLEGPGTSELGFVFPTTTIIHFTVPRGRHANLKAWKEETFIKYFEKSQETTSRAIIVNNFFS